MIGQFHKTESGIDLKIFDVEQIDENTIQISIKSPDLRFRIVNLPVIEQPMVKAKIICEILQSHLIALHTFTSRRKYQLFNFVIIR